MAIETSANLPSARVTAAVLAGGGSSRFGSDKALATLPGNDATFLGRVVTVARSVAAHVVIVAPDRPGYRTAGARIVPDRFPGEGPAGGVVTALRAVETEWLVVLSCDQPYVETQDIEVLLSAAPSTPVAAFGTSADSFQPLPCAIRADACRAIAEDVYAAGVRSLRQLLSRCGVTAIPVRDPDIERRLRDIDSPADLP